MSGSAVPRTISTAYREGGPTGKYLEEIESVPTMVNRDSSVGFGTILMLTDSLPPSTSQLQRTIEVTYDSAALAYSSGAKTIAEIRSLGLLDDQSQDVQDYDLPLSIASWMGSDQRNVVEWWQTTVDRAELDYGSLPADSSPDFASPPLQDPGRAVWAAAGPIPGPRLTLTSQSLHDNSELYVFGAGVAAGTAANFLVLLMQSLVARQQTTDSMAGLNYHAGTCTRPHETLRRGTTVLGACIAALLLIGLVRSHRSRPHDRPQR